MSYLLCTYIQGTADTPKSCIHIKTETKICPYLWAVHVQELETENLYLWNKASENIGPRETGYEMGIFENELSIQEC